MTADPVAREAALKFRDLTTHQLLIVIHNYTMELADTPAPQRRPALLHLSAAYAEATRRGACLCGCLKSTKEGD